MDSESTNPTPATTPTPRILVAGLLAGLVAWLGGEALHGRFSPKLLSHFDIGGGEMNARIVAGERLEATIAFAILGGTLGLALGLAGPPGRRRMAAGSAGLALGTTTGAVLAWFLLAIYYRNVDRDVDNLMLPVLTFGGIWGLIGAAGGFARAIGRGDRGQFAPAIMGGLLGALAATLVIELLGGLAFPLARATEPLPESWAARLLARLLVATFVAGGIVLADRTLRPDPGPRGVAA